MAKALQKRKPSTNVGREYYTELYNYKFKTELGDKMKAADADRRIRAFIHIRLMEADIRSQ